MTVFADKRVGNSSTSPVEKVAGQRIDRHGTAIPLKIPDNFPLGVTSSIRLDDFALLKAVKVDIHICNIVNTVPGVSCRFKPSDSYVKGDATGYTVLSSAYSESEIRSVTAWAITGESRRSSHISTVFWHRMAKGLSSMRA